MAGDKTDYERERESRIAANRAKIAVSSRRLLMEHRMRRSAGPQAERAPATPPQTRKKRQELGINDSLAEMKAPTPAKAPRQKRAKAEVPLSPSEMRRSSRPRTEVNYAEDIARALRGPAEPKDYTERIAAVQLDEETAERLRLEAEARRAEKAAAAAAGEAKQQRGPIDSGKGVRVQVRGGRLRLLRESDAHWARDRSAHTSHHAPTRQGGRVYDSKFGVTCHW